MTKHARIAICAVAVHLSCIFLVAGSCRAEAGCVKHEAHDSATFLLIYRSDEFKNAEGLKQTILAVREMVQPGERLIVGLSAARSADTRIVMDLVHPKKDIWESALKTRAKEKAFNDCVAAAEQKLIAERESHSSSAILETLGFVRNLFSLDQSGTKRLVFFSDMMQNSETLSFYAKGFSPEAALKSAEKEALLLDLKGIAVYVAGAGATVSEKIGRHVEQFWRKYFEKAGADLKFYGPLLPGA